MRSKSSFFILEAPDLVLESQNLSQLGLSENEERPKF